MAVVARSRFESLVKDDAVHRSVYTDPTIFSEEMERIFARTWVYAGHESEIPNPGDFKTDVIAGRSIILVRHTDAQVYGLYNRCMHRGALVCEQDSGHAEYLRCPYHAWTYRTNGELALVPLRETFGPDFDLADYGLRPLPRVGSYRGFLFVSLSPEGPDLDEHLGRARHYIDLFVDRSPTGEIRVVNPLKYEYHGNWKLQMENMADSYHAQYVHASAMAAFTAGPSGGAGKPVLSWHDHMDRSFGAGHGVMAWRGMIVANRRDHPGYFDALASRQGEPRAEELAHLNIHVMVYPNLILHTNYQHIRVVRPKAVDFTEIHTYPCELVGAPADVNEALVRNTSIHVSPAGRFQVDDLEVFQRVQQGLQIDAADWVLFKMRAPDEHVNEHGERACSGISEMVPRGYYREWLRLMSQE